MDIKLINIGFGNIVAAGRVIAVVSPDSAPIKRIIQEARDSERLIDASYGRRTRSVIIMDSDHVVLFMKQGLLIVVSGPSGTGKGTVCGKLLAETPQLAYSISATTRQPREGEVDGQNYYFLTREQFETEIAAGGFLEYADVYGNYYGTPLKKLEERLQAGQDILLEIDTQGALNVMKKCPNGIFIFLLPPSPLRKANQPY